MCPGGELPLGIATFSRLRVRELLEILDILFPKESE
jgi:hypothetical protein